jgi:2,4-dienoyl-CoA reductase-like NADH-dependent reductase (Old Yellow Enzyme family)
LGKSNDKAYLLTVQESTKYFGAINLPKSHKRKKTRMNSKFEVAFKPFTFRSGTEIKNRIVMAPMTNTASHENGEVSDEQVAYYRERAGGVGTVITACTYVTRNGKGFPGEFGADSDSLIPSCFR